MEGGRKKTLEEQKASRCVILRPVQEIRGRLVGGRRNGLPKDNEKGTMSWGGRGPSRPPPTSRGERDLFKGESLPHLKNQATAHAWDCDKTIRLGIRVLTGKLFRERGALAKVKKDRWCGATPPPRRAERT